MRRAALILLLVACGVSVTEEERVLQAVGEIRAALATHEPDAIWDHFSTRRRNLFHEVRLLRSAGVEPDWENEASLPPEKLADAPISLWDYLDGDIVKRIDTGVAARMSDREFHAAVHEGWEPVPAMPEPAGVRILEDCAEVEDHVNRVRWWLRLEGGEWKLEGWLFESHYDDSGLEYLTGPGGREYVFQQVGSLWAPNAHSVPLPGIDLCVEVDSFRADVRHLAVDVDRPYVMRGETLDAQALLQRLLDFAETGRDLDHPMQFSTRQVHLAIHRDLPWSRADAALRILADPDVRIRRVTFLTQEHLWSTRHQANRSWGMPFLIQSRVPPDHSGPRLPALKLRVGNDAQCLLLRVGLREVLAAIPDLYVDPGEDIQVSPDGELEAGIQVTLSPDMKVGPAVEALATVARRGYTEIILHTAEKPFTGWTLNGREIPPGQKWESPETSTEVSIVLLLKL